MALQLKIKKDGITTTGFLVIKDVTGDYDATTNPGGYGTPNPDRDEVALVVRAFNNRYDSSASVVSNNVEVTPDNTDPLIAANWNVTINKQGWYKVVLYGLSILDSDVLLSVGEIVWNPLTSSIERIANREGSGPYTYTTVAVTPEDLDGNTYAKAYSVLLDTYADNELCVCFNKAVRYSYKSKEEADKERYRKIRCYLTVMKLDFLTGSPAEGQKIVEQVESICNCFAIDCNC